MHKFLNELCDPFILPLLAAIVLFFLLGAASMYFFILVICNGQLV